MMRLPSYRYRAPKTVQDLIDHVVGKVLDLLKIEHALFRRWGGAPSDAG